MGMKINRTQWKLQQRLTIVLLCAVLLAVGLQPAAHAVVITPNLTVVTDNPYSIYNAISKSDYTFTFKASASLAAEDEIRIRVPVGYSNYMAGNFPSWYSSAYLNSESQVRLYVDSELTTIMASEVVDNDIVLTLNSEIAADATLEIEVKDFLYNPFGYGKYTFEIVMGEGQPITGEVSIIDSKVADFRVTPNTRVNLVTNVGYTFSFLSMAPITESDQIIISMPQGVVQERTTNNSYIQVNGVEVASYTLESGTGRLVIDPSQDISSLTEVTVQVSDQVGLVNPAMDPHSFEVYTTGDLEPREHGYVYFHGEDGSQINDFYIYYEDYEESSLRIFYDYNIDLYPGQDYVRIKLPTGISADQLDLENSILMGGGVEREYQLEEYKVVAGYLELYIPEEMYLRGGYGLLVDIPVIGEFPGGVHTFYGSTSQETLELEYVLEYYQVVEPRLLFAQELIAAGQQQPQYKLQLTFDRPVTYVPSSEPFTLKNSAVEILSVDYNSQDANKVYLNLSGPLDSAEASVQIQPYAFYYAGEYINEEASEIYIIKQSDRLQLHTDLLSMGNTTTISISNVLKYLHTDRDKKGISDAEYARYVLRTAFE